MTNRERFRRLMSFQSVDRLPLMEWATWWNKTIDRWHQEGLPPELTDGFEIRCYFGLDKFQQYWIGAIGSGTPAPPFHGAGVMGSGASYDELLEFLYPREAFNKKLVEGWAEQQATGELVVWITLEGFFWFPRTLLGIERHLYSFYDEPELLHRMNTDLLEFNLHVLDEFCELCVPDFMTFAEDMSYNHGPMLSREHFDEFVAPYYRQITPVLHERGILPFVDTDGNVTDLVPWMQEVGVRGFLPLERMAGVDVNQLRRDYPDLLMIGAFDKTVMHLGEEAMRAEFERLMPVMKSGGYIPSVDHQTPPEVSLEDYRLYLRLLREYVVKGKPEL
ncbi:MAG: hypothetical protein J7M26_08900 [Armatimonadetes bacterium]|nr:hypothetical protein [Armatimonadota bacterium]